MTVVGVGRQGTTHLPLVVSITDTQIRHRPQDRHQGLDCIAIHDRPVLFEILAREAALVDDPAEKKKQKLTTSK